MTTDFDMGTLEFALVWSNESCSARSLLLFGVNLKEEGFSEIPSVLPCQIKFWGG